MNNKILSERLKQHRKEKGLTQKQLSEKLGVAYSVIAGAETKRGISKSLASKLADLFGTDIDYWINEDAEKEFIKEMNFLETTKAVMKRLMDENVLTLDNLDSIENDIEINKIINQSLRLDAKIYLMKKEQN